MEYTMQNLEYAVSVFYNGEQAERAKAHTWLTAAQRVPEAWNFVWDLLQPTKGTEIQFFAATTLHTKILRCWNELPSESYEELKNKLLQSVITYANGPKIVTNRLCISLAAFILQRGSEDLPSTLVPLSSTQNSSLLLEVLTVIPEEYNSMTMGTSLRSKNRAALHQACSMVMDDMLRILQTVFNDYSNSPPSEETINSWTLAASCAASWLSLGSDESTDSPISFTDRTPMLRALQTAVHVLYVSNGVVSGSALEACEACLSAVRVAGTHGDAHRHQRAARALLSDLASLVAPVMAEYNVPDSINEELLCALITCCVAVAECHSGTLVQMVQEGTEGGGEGTSAGAEAGAGGKLLLQLLLAAQASPGYYPLHETRSNLLFGFWYTLQDEILNVTDGTEKMQPIWRDVFSQLLVTLITKSEMPPDSDLSQDDLELMRCYRQDVGDAIMYCYAVLGEWCWEVVERAFTGAHSEGRREAVLHAFAALADVARHGDAPASLPAMLRHAVHLVGDTTDQRTLDTALDCIGTYASWICWLETEAAGRAAGAEPLGMQCVRAAGGALARSPVAAALALRRLACDCAAPAAALVHDIVQAALSAEGTSDAWVRRQLTSAAGAALAASEPRTALPLLARLAHHLAAQIAVQSQAESGGTVAAECGAALMAGLSCQPPLAAELLRALLPALAAMPHVPRLVEPMFLVLKQTVSTMMGDCVPFIDQISQLTITAFNTKPCPIGLDVVKLLVLMVGEECEQVKEVLLSAVCATARLLAQSQLTNTTPPKFQKPDLVEALFTMLHMMTRKKPHFIDALESVVPDLVQLACGCVRVWEVHAARSSCLFLSALAARNPRALRDAAPELTYAALRCIGGASPRNQMEPLAELLLALNRAAWGSGSLGTWLRAALTAPDFPTHHATPAHKHRFIDAVLREKTSKRKLLESVHEFSLVCRGLVDTEYAKQTIASKQLVT
ncbi:importin-13 [Colias croceus]|uniref:importin-13 n=1 Tax=Colias crocea TaxID=72248 RepID=UPI001E281511|nr:importin-13 [Colias croceus]